MGDKPDPESDPSHSRTSGHPVSSLLNTAESGRKSCSSLPEVVLQVRERIEPSAGERQNVGAEGGGGAGAGVGIGDRSLGVIKKLFTKKTKVSKRITPTDSESRYVSRVSRTSSRKSRSQTERYNPEDDLHFEPPQKPASATSLDLTAELDLGNLLISQSVGGGHSVYEQDWELGASFGNFPDDEEESLSDESGSVHLSEQSEDTGDNISEFGSLLSHESTRLRN